MVPYNSPKQLAVFLAQHGLSLKKRFGQNFLVNADVRGRILSLLSPARGTRVWEIGPGLGCMSAAILETGALLNVFEIDRGFIKILVEEFSARENFRLIEGDVLKTWPPLRDEKPGLIFGNLPYNSAAALIADFLEKDFIQSRWVFMVQKEVAARMAAKPGTKNYSSFSLLCQTFMTVQLLFEVSPAAFYPRPEVFSCVAGLQPRPDQPVILCRGIFFGILRALFASRRKTLKNNLLPWAASLGKDADWVTRLLDNAGLRPEIRGETLSAADAVSLANQAARLIR
ncbi:MAG: 16S rRNA (adenine(1518)-N(6)/adenine(1519)-N(6))-dimethyltransferase RsmA [Spirochaetales bacterium]|jgi:16S rRNA (adenine1518-N6/adenine1519-N6)-dimethyltransferase|nr:16S rRNA (adenine(1518)-N(6)/adenine(1519)-N(6))-dimethyltransferase RsmA [Spirochaetales bacterium]